MIKLTNTEVGTVNASIKLAISKVLGSLSYVSNADRADVAQIAWIKFLEGFNPTRAMLEDAVMPEATAKGSSTFTRSAHGAFAYRAACNAAIDFLRSRKGARLDSRFVSTDAPMGEDGDTVGSILPDRTPTPIQALIAKRRNAAVLEAILQLSDDEQASLISDDEGPRPVAERVRKTRAIAKIQESVIG